MTFDDGAETLAGVTRARRRSGCATLDVAAIGANHGSGLLAALEALEQMRGDGLPLAALPNIGLASLSGGRVDLPACDARVLRRVRRAGAQPRRAGDRRLLRHDPDRDRGDPRRGRGGSASRGRSSSSERELVEALGEEQRETALARALREGEFVVSVQLDPPLGGSARGLLEVARELSDGGVRFVDVNDNATARAGMSSLMVSARIERETGLETSRT